VSLRTRLLGLSVFVLLLALAGWTLVRSMEQSLRQALEQALVDTAASVGRKLLEQTDNWPAADGLYIHPASQPFELDGHDDDWAPCQDWRQQLDSPTPEASASVLAASHQDRLHLLVNVRDRALVTADPVAGPGDRIVIVVHNAGRTGQTTLAPVAPGWLSATEHSDWPRLHGALQPTSDGWRAELRLLEPARPEALAVSITNVEDRQERQSAVMLGRQNAQPLVRPQPGMAAQLSVLLPDNTRGWVITPAGWVVAGADRRRTAPPDQTETPGFQRPLTALAGRLLGIRPDPALTNTALAARLDIAERHAHDQSAAWLQHSDTGLAIAAAVPLRVNGQLVARIVVEREADRSISLAYSAIAQLFTLGLAGLLILAVVLIGFAARLSARIRRLRNAAERAVAPDGRVRQDLAPISGSDELNDLAAGLRRMIARQREHQHYLQSLASRLSHELRTPLAMIRSSLDNLGHAGDEQQRRRYLARAEDGCQRLQATLQAMSQAARIEHALITETREDVDLGRLVERYTEGCRTTFGAHDFSAIVPSGRRARVHASEDLLAQLLDKLIDNAVSFAPAGSRITLRVMPRGPRIAVQVDNPGPSLPDGLAEQLFDSLTSARPGQEQRGHLGIGLYVARMIAEHHGGHIRAVNRPGGCRFEVDLPRGPDQELR